MVVVGWRAGAWEGWECGERWRCKGVFGGQAGTVVVEEDGWENGATHMCSAVGQVYMGVLGV